MSRKATITRKRVMHAIRLKGIDRFENKHISNLNDKQLLRAYNSCHEVQVNPGQKGFTNFFFDLLPKVAQNEYVELREKAKSDSYKKYTDYLLSQEWKDKREELFAVRGRNCELCGSTKNIQVHHLHYKTLFNENLEDLQVVCSPCHKNIHGKGSEKTEVTEVKPPKNRIIFKGGMSRGRCILGPGHRYTIKINNSREYSLNNEQFEKLHSFIRELVNS